MPNFTKRQPITITNASGGVLAHYAVKLAIVYDADMQAAFADLRFSDAQGQVAYPHWLESKVDSTSAVVWVKVPYLAVGANTIYMYYGDAIVPSTSDGKQVFPFFEDAFADMALADHIDPPTQLALVTPDGSGQTTHPSVVYFADGWGVGSKKWWMTATPYAAGNNTLENPCIWSSDDGIAWAVPAGATNPLVAKPTDGYNSDPCMVWDDQTFKLKIYWRRQNNTPIPDVSYICMIQSADGITWTDAAGTNVVGMSSDDLTTNCAVIGPQTATDGNNDVSPCIIKEGANDWHYWCTMGTNIIYYRTSLDGITWSDPPTACTQVITGYHLNSNVIWHLGVLWSPTLNKYLMFGCLRTGFERVFLLESTDKTTWTRLTYDVFAKNTNAAAWDALNYTTRAVEVDGNIYIYNSRYMDGAPDTWFVGALSGYSTQQIYDYCAGVQRDYASNAVCWWRDQVSIGGSVAAAGGVATMTPYTGTAAEDSHAAIRAGHYKCTNNMALRANIHPSANNTILGFAGGRATPQVQARFFYETLALGYGLYTSIGNWYLFRANGLMSTTAMGNAAGGVYTDAYHTWELRYAASGRLQAMLDDVQIVNNDSVVGDTYLATEKYPYISHGCYHADASTCLVNWMLARQWVETEPTHIFGAEEAGNWNVLSDRRRDFWREPLLAN
jgi:hypothetical protein